MASFKDVIIGTGGIPAIVTLTSNESDFTDATPFEIQIVFDYAVTGFVVGDISITNATLSNFTGSGTSYTADVTPALTGDVSVSVARNVVNERNRPSNVVNIADLSKAYVTVTSEVEDFTDATPFRIFVDFDKNVTGFVSGDINVVNGTLSSFGMSSGSSYSAYVTPDLTGSVAVSVAENVVNEDNYASNNKIITYITAVANCIITSDESGFTDATPFEIQITFSKAVTGFVVGDITISNATLSNFAGSGTTYTADVTPDLTGDISISVAENVTVEGNSASNTVNVTYDAPALLLDTYSDSVVAIALIKLSSTYTGDCIRVRRDSDNAESDIGFDGNLMDTTTLTSFVGMGSGYVVTWYDQSGIGNDMTQVDTSKQPLIVDTGVIQTDNGMPTMIQKVGSSNKGLVAGVTSYNFPTSIYAVCRPQSARCVLFTDASLSYLGGMSESGNSGYIVQIGTSYANFIINNNVVTPATRGQVYNEFSLSQGIFGLQNLDMTSWTQLSTIRSTGSIGPYESLQAFIVFDADTTPDESAISTYLNGIYGTY